MNDLLSLLDTEAADLLSIEGAMADPGIAFRALYDRWVKRGPFRQGKPLHSARMIKIWLGEAKGVRSLETKLAGQTRLPRQDALNLTTLFLERWVYENGSETGRPLEDENPQQLAIRIVNELYSSSSDTILLPGRKRGQLNAKLQAKSKFTGTGEVRRSRDVLKELFVDSDALITISKERTLVADKPAQSMTLFHSLMEQLRDIDRQDDRKRALIWVVDFGLRDARESSAVVFLNMVSLATQFRSIGIFDPKGQMELWRDLEKRVVVIVGSLNRHEIDYIYGLANLKLPEAEPGPQTVIGDRMFLEAVPRRWLEIAQYTDTFELDQTNFWQHPTVTAHLSLPKWDMPHNSEIDPKNDLRYFYHAPVPPDNVAHCIELQQPGIRWSDGFRMACDAAFWRLGFTDKSLNRSASPGTSAALLRNDRFAVLTLHEFTRLTNKLIEANLERINNPSTTNCK